MEESSFFNSFVNDVWKSLPEELLQCRTVQTFKRYLDLYLYNRAYLSFLELLFSFLRYVK